MQQIPLAVYVGRVVVDLNDDPVEAVLEGRDVPSVQAHAEITVFVRTDDSCQCNVRAHVVPLVGKGVVQVDEQYTHARALQNGISLTGIEEIGADVDAAVRLLAKDTEIALRHAEIQLDIFNAAAKLIQPLDQGAGHGDTVLREDHIVRADERERLRDTHQFAAVFFFPSHEYNLLKLSYFVPEYIVPFKSASVK